VGKAKEAERRHSRIRVPHPVVLPVVSYHQRTVTTGQDRIRTTDVGGGQSQALMQRPAPIQQKQQVKQKQADAAQKQGVISMEEGTSFSSYGTNST
jgi:hypothetical protein